MHLITGSKTETSRIIGDHHRATQVSQLKWMADYNSPMLVETEKYIKEVWDMNPDLGFAPAHRGRVKWCVGELFTIKPAYGKLAVARAKVLEITQENVLEADDEWAKAEGFDSVLDFWKIWATMHDPTALSALEKIDYLPSSLYLRLICLVDHSESPEGDLAPNKWNCWRVKFELVDVYDKNISQPSLVVGGW